MFEGKVAAILNAQLGAFVEGLDAKALNIGVWSGQIVLENLQVGLLGRPRPRVVPGPTLDAAERR